MEQKILCIGSVTADVIVSPVDSLPPSGSLQAVSAVQTHVGGCASNCAMALSHLGASPLLSCCVGKDNFGSFVQETLQKNGVPLTGVVSRPDIETTVSIVCVSSEGERSFLYNPGSTSAFLAEDILPQFLNEAGIVFVADAMLLTAFDGVPCAEFLHRARQMGKLTALDTAWDFEGIWLPKVESALAYLDWFLPSIAEARQLSGCEQPEEMARFFQERGAKNVLIKLGKDGALLCEEGKTPEILPTYGQIKPVDTTGAGDTFCAGFLYGLSHGWSAHESACFANAVATHCIMHIGAAAGIPHADEVLRFMRENSAQAPEEL